MASLGFVRNAAQCPANIPRVYLHRSAAAGSALRAWSGKGHKGGVELRWDAPAGELEAWTGAMADAISDLGWRSWWLDTASVAKALGGTPQEALTRWGLAFWGRYRRVASVYLLLGEMDRKEMAATVKVWEQGFGHMRYHERLDIDLQMMQKAEELQNKPVRRTLVKFFPVLFKSL